MRDTPKPSRILFVDDEPAIRRTLPAILEMHGFEVISAGTVAEALDAITRQPFDVLLADLNIGQPGDGFTVVSAMRRTQPNAVTIIITGYPAFETALEAIRNQVDDYIVKPADIPNLMQIIKQHLKAPRKHTLVPRKHLCDILHENNRELIAEWLAAVKADPDLANIPVSDEARQNQLSKLLKELIDSLERHPEALSQRALECALRHGRERRRQGYSIVQMLKEAAHLRRTIGIIVQQHLLAVDISNLMTEMIQTGYNVDYAVRASVEGYLQERAPAPRVS